MSSHTIFNITINDRASSTVRTRSNANKQMANTVSILQCAASAGPRSL